MMKIVFNVRVTPNAKTPSVAKMSDTSYLIKVNAPVFDGKANERLIEILSRYFNVPKSHVRILQGLKSRVKTVEVLPSS
jgi:uncharacterized protein